MRATRLPRPPLAPSDTPEEDIRWCQRCHGYRLKTDFTPKGLYCVVHDYKYPSQMHNPERARRYSLKHFYGMSMDDYDALMAQQGGVCAVCARAETHLARRATMPRLKVDHDHATGKVRGLLCQKCNLALGALDDNPARIRALLAYAERFQS